MTDRALPSLMTKRLHLRLGHASDASSIAAFQLANQSHFAGMRPKQPLDVFQTDYWASKLPQLEVEYRTGQSVNLFGFQRAGDHLPIAMINFTNITRGPAQFCYLGFGVDRAHEGHGYMCEALPIAMEFVFCELNLHRIMANYRPTNERSGLLLRSLGFTIEGYAKDYLFLDDAWRDHVLASITNEAWHEMPA